MARKEKGAEPLLARHLDPFRWAGRSAIHEVNVVQQTALGPGGLPSIPGLSRGPPRCGGLEESTHSFDLPYRISHLSHRIYFSSLNSRFEKMGADRYLFKRHTTNLCEGAQGRSGPAASLRAVTQRIVETPSLWSLNGDWQSCVIARVVSYFKPLYNVGVSIHGSETFR